MLTFLGTANLIMLAVAISLTAGVLLCKLPRRPIRLLTGIAATLYVVVFFNCLLICYLTGSW